MTNSEFMADILEKTSDEHLTITRHQAETIMKRDEAMKHTVAQMERSLDSLRMALAHYRVAASRKS